MIDFDDYLVRFQLPTSIIKFISYLCSDHWQYHQQSNCTILGVLQNRKLDSEYFTTYLS